MAYTQAFPILHSDDFKRLVAFYTESLGLPVTFRFPPEGEGDAAFLTVGAGTSTIGIGDYSGVEAMFAPTPRGGKPFQLCLCTDQLDAELERLRAAGTPVHLEPVDQPWGERMCYIADPDGNLIMLVQSLG